jgi:hypothetical protein
MVVARAAADYLGTDLSVCHTLVLSASGAANPITYFACSDSRGNMLAQSHL